jgi:hypothetical protein
MTSRQKADGHDLKKFHLSLEPSLGAVFQRRFKLRLVAGDGDHRPGAAWARGPLERQQPPRLTVLACLTYSFLAKKPSYLLRLFFLLVLSLLPRATSPNV